MAQDKPFGVLIITVHVPFADVRTSSTCPFGIKPKATGASR